MGNGSILIISNDEQAGVTVKDKLKLLRSSDTIKQVTYIEAISALNSTQPSLIMVYCQSFDSISIIKEIRTLKYLDKVPIIFIMDKFDEDLLIYAFDNGIDDFILKTDPDSVILTRILLTIQKSVLYKQIDMTSDILSAAGIIDKETGIYTKEYTPLAFKHFFSKSIEENMEGTVFMCIKPAAIPNQKLNRQAVMQKLAEVIKKVPRGNDIAAFGKNLTFYLILYNAGEAGAKNVASRMSKMLADTCKIYASSAEITASFEEMEPVLLQGIQEQMSSGAEFNFLYDLELSEAAEVMDIHDENGKNFKDFKKEFYKGFERIAAPVFYHMQAVSSGMFSKAKINFDITENESSFTISQEEAKSSLVITYPSYMKIIADIKNKCGSKPEQARRLTFDFEDFSAEQLSSMLLDMVKEFEAMLKEYRGESVLPE